MSKGFAALALCACLGCGVHPVELLPVEHAVGADEFSVGDVPGEALARFRSQRSAQGEKALKLIQPLPPELVVPADLAPIRFEWETDAKGKPPMMSMQAMVEAMMPAEDPMAEAKAGKAKPPKEDKELPVAYELRAHSELADVRVYVVDPAAAFPVERWRKLLREHIDATLRIELRGVYRDSTLVHAPALELRVRAPLPAGLFYSFSATGQGINVAQLSRTHEHALAVPESLVAAEPGRCVGCHALSRDGKRVLATDPAGGRVLHWSLGSHEAVALDWPETLALPGYIQASFDPTAARIAASAAGQLLIFDADSGALLQHSGMPLMASLSHPSWSPDGRSIVVESARGPDEPERSGLARVTVGLDGLLALMPLLDPGGDEHLRAPAYSPDGEWIAYERRKGPDGDGKDNKLFLVRAQGGEPIELRALSQGMKARDRLGAPAFAPAGEPGHAYLLFTSGRQVGVHTPAEGQRQLFASELDLSLAAAGEDPSHAAFWLPFQQRSNNYLQVQWAPAQRACTPMPELCDDLDDDCDDIVDEDCCEPVAERCGDGQDDDCDARVDEGCACALREVCGNQLDDDCDLGVDEQPCDSEPPAP